jgi:hypothetical protein
VPVQIIYRYQNLDIHSVIEVTEVGWLILLGLCFIPTVNDWFEAKTIHAHFFSE